MSYRDDPALSVNVKGLTFHTPVGLAAGFDKHAEAPLGFCKYVPSGAAVEDSSPLRPVVACTQWVEEIHSWLLLYSGLVKGDAGNTCNCNRGSS